MNKLSALLATTMFLWVFLPALTHAQDTFNNIEPQVVDGTISNVTQNGFIPCSGTDCSPCDLVVMFNTILEWFLGISFLLFAVLAMIAGIKMVTAQGAVTLGEAKKSFTNAFIGLIIILSAWLLVDTIMRGLMGSGGEIDGYGPWTEVKCADQNDVRTKEGFFTGDPTYEAAIITPNGETIPAGNPAAAAPGLTQEAAEARLRSAGIEWVSGIKLAGIRPHAIDGAIRLDKACGCNVTITSTTGGSHSTKGGFTHANGFKIDFRTRDNTRLVSYIRSLPSAGKWTDGTPLYNGGNCTIYADETNRSGVSPHIDAAFKSGC